MPKVVATVECPVYDSFKVQQMAGMFDVSLDKKCSQKFEVEVPGLSEDWKIGAIVGPSGSGKSTIARQAFGDSVYQDGHWPVDAAIVDCFGNNSIRDITAMLNSVGFSSPPSWVKPYRVLSNGEKFRANLARALLSDSPIVVYDEFTSVVDRVVGRIGSAAVAKAVRASNKRFVAVSCHSDILEWLCPDWTVDMSTQTLARGCLRRPPITIEIIRCKGEAWRLFRQHHYLSTQIHQSATCFLATWEGEPVAFVAMLHQFGWKNFYRVHRTVVLPDYQGIGIGSRVTESVCKHMKSLGNRVSIVTNHPGFRHHLDRSPLWRCRNVQKTGNNLQSKATRIGAKRKTSAGRPVISYEFVG